MASDHRNEINRLRDAFFTRIVQEHSRLLYRVAYSVLRNPADAEDAVGDAFLKLLRGNAWREVINERAFLARTVWRTALDRSTASGRDAARRPAGDEEAELLLLRDGRPSPEGLASEGDVRTRMHACIDRLPPELRETLLLSAMRS